MEFFKLKYFYAVAECEHFTKASEKIHIAQPALTQAIKSLEEELDAPLFQKVGRNVKLTDYGKYLKEKLDKILPEIEEIPYDIQALKHQANKTVKINILAASTFTIACIVQYRQKHPDVIIDVYQNELKSGCDLTIYTNGTKTSTDTVIKRCVKTEKIYLAVPIDSEYASRKEIDLGSLKDEKFVMLSGSRAFRTICDKLCACVGFTPKTLFESDSPTAVQNIVSTGAGIAFWPEFSWGKLKNKNVRLVPVSTPISQRELIVELHETLQKSDYASDFFEFLTDKM